MKRRRTFKKEIAESIIKISMIFGLLGLINNSLFDAVFIGLGAGILFAVLGALQLWVNRKLHAGLLEKYTNHSYFQKLNFETVDDETIRGSLGEYGVELNVLVVAEGRVQLNLKINLSKKPHLNNHSNLKRALKRTKFQQLETTVFIPNWKPRLNTLKKFDLVVIKIQELLNRIEGKQS